MPVINYFHNSSTPPLDILLADSRPWMVMLLSPAAKVFLNDKERKKKDGSLILRLLNCKLQNVCLCFGCHFLAYCSLTPCKNALECGAKPNMHTVLCPNWPVVKGTGIYRTRKVLL